MVLKEIVAVFSENRVKPINSVCRQNTNLLNVKEGDTYRYHWALNVLSRMYRVCILTQHFFNIHFNIILPSLQVFPSGLSP